MKKIIFLSILIVTYLSLNAQTDRTVVLQSLEKSKGATQSSGLTATVKSATRLFGDKNDLTSVITVIPQGSVVPVTGSDSTFLKVVYEESEGFILSRHAVIENNMVADKPEAVRQQNTAKEQPVRQSGNNRLAYLEKKYGQSIASRLFSGKIWKGMSASMVQDSWGSPQKINRVISGNIIKEEWFYNNTWLYIQNNVLADWGPVKR